MGTCASTDVGKHIVAADDKQSAAMFPLHADTHPPQGAWRCSQGRALAPASMHRDSTPRQAQGPEKSCPCI